MTIDDYISNSLEREWDKFIKRQTKNGEYILKGLKDAIEHK